MQTIAQATPTKRAHLERATYTLAEFAALLGISYTQAHESAQAGTLAVTPIRQGRKYLFPRATVHRLLDIDAGDTDTAA